MYVRIADTAEVEDVHNFRQLHVELAAVDDAAAGAALSAAGLGVLADGHAWLEIPALRAAGDGSPAWTGEFDSMIEYARTHGWVDEATGRVRAHIVRG